MKREEKLLYAIGCVDDDLIAGAMAYRQIKHMNPLHWVAVAACICLLLTVTVGAAMWSVEWWRSQTTGYVFPVDTDPENWPREEVQVDTVEWKYPLEPVTIRQEALDEMNTELNRWWSYWYKRDGGIDPDFADYHFTIGIGYDPEQRFTTVGELEEFLGVDLTLSPEMEAAARNCMETNDIGTWLEIALYGDINRDAEQEYLQNGQITLQGIGIIMRMGFSGTNCKSWADIVIPVTEKFAETYPAEQVYNLRENVPLRADTRLFADREVLVIEDTIDDLEKAGWLTVRGAYASDGIGYCVHCCVEDWDDPDRHKPVYQHGVERLDELLENLE